MESNVETDDSYIPRRNYLLTNTKQLSRSGVPITLNPNILQRRR